MKTTQKKYTFNDWADGSVCLSVAPRIQNDQTVIVDESNFSKQEWDKITEEQIQIFNSEVAELEQKFKDDLLARLENSQLKKDLIKREVKKIKNVLFAKLPPYPETGIVSVNQVPFTYSSLQEIKLYAKNVILDGLKFDFRTIHNKNSQCKIEEIQSPIYAQALFNHLNYITKQSQYNKNKKAETNYAKHINKHWFNVGIFFANGKIDELIKKHSTPGSYNYNKIARELGHESYRPYISSSNNQISDTDKNIFSNKSKIQAIKDYCKDNDIKIVASFHKRVKEGLPLYD